MKKGRNLLVRAGQHMDLPLDLVTGVPRMELIGQEEFSLEPHCGLLAYSETEVRLGSRVGEISVLGKQLIIKMMNERRIVLSGRILQVMLPEEKA